MQRCREVKITLVKHTLWKAPVVALELLEEATDGAFPELSIFSITKSSAGTTLDDDLRGFDLCGGVVSWSGNSTNLRDWTDLAVLMVPMSTNGSLTRLFVVASAALAVVESNAGSSDAVESWLHGELLGSHTLLRIAATSRSVDNTL